MLARPVRRPFGMNRTRRLLGLLTLLRDTFIHIGDAKVTFSLGSNRPSQVNTVIINRASVQLLCLAE